MNFILIFLKKYLGKFLPGLSSPYLIVGVAIASFAAGGWLVYKVVKADEAEALEAALKSQQTYYVTEAEIRARTQAKALQRANERSTVQEAIRYVKDSPDCDLPPIVAGVLDQRLQGRSLDPGNYSPEPRGIEGISQGQSLNALDSAAEAFYGCRDQLKGINERLQSCSVLCE